VMTPKHEVHLAAIKAEAQLRMDAKYRKGQAEHGGALWKFTPLALVEEALNEAYDQVIYLESLRDVMLKGVDG
jgi:hypothetical protein